jgi:Chaperone of endosialidase
MSIEFSTRQLLICGIPELHEEGFLKKGRKHCSALFKKGGGGGQAPAPDPAIGAAAMENVQLGKDWLSFAKEQFNQGNERQVTTDALNTRVINQQLDTQDEATRIAREDRDRTKRVFQPVENGFITTAQEFDTPAKQAEAAAAAKADVLANTTIQQQGAQRQMASMGVRPDSGRFAGITRAQDTNTALAAAGAQNAARNMIRDKGIALKSDAINIGKGLPSSTISAYGLGTNSGNSAVGNNASGNANFYANQGVMSQGFQGNIGANNSAGSMLSNLYGNQLNAWQAKQQANATSAAGIGQLVGTGIGAYAALSDERTKYDIKKIGQLNNGINLYSFKYKEEFAAKNGHGMQIGCIAQEVEKIIPEAVETGSDGYKSVNYNMVYKGAEQ